MPSSCFKHLAIDGQWLQYCWVMIFLPSVTWPFWTLGVQTQDLPHYVLPLYTSPFDPPLGVPHLLHGNPNETLDRLHPIMAHPLVSTNVTVETP